MRNFESSSRAGSREPTLVDAGPLVALIHADDENHERCADAARRIRSPLVTAWPAVTEAMYLLSFSWKAQEALWEMAERKALFYSRSVPRIFLGCEHS